MLLNALRPTVRQKVLTLTPIFPFILSITYDAKSSYGCLEAGTVFHLLPNCSSWLCMDKFWSVNQVKEWNFQEDH